MRNWTALVYLTAFLTVGAVLLSCAPSGSGQGASHEAYLLLDRGENAQAIALLEAELAKNPEKASADELNLLLASAFAGEAGINVYQLHDSFRDTLFSRPMNTLWEDGQSRQGWPDFKAPQGDIPPGAEDAPLLRLVANMDIYMTQVWKVTAFLHRFPNIPEKNWPLLDTALEALDRIESNDRDVGLYRVFLRVVYLKGFFSARVINNPDFGSRKWACKLVVEKWGEDLGWVAVQLTAGAGEFSAAFPGHDFMLADFHKDAVALLAEMKAARDKTNLETKLRDLFRCD